MAVVAVVGVKKRMQNSSTATTAFSETNAMAMTADSNGALEYFLSKT